MVPGVSRVSKSAKASRMIDRCMSGLSGGPQVCPRGKSVKAARGGLAEAVIDRALVIERVGTPFASIARLISPTDW